MKTNKPKNQSPLTNPVPSEKSDAVSRIDEDASRGIFSTEDLEKEIIDEVFRVFPLLKEEVMLGYAINLTIEKTTQRLKAEVEKIIDDEDFKKFISSIIAGNYKLKSVEIRDMILKELKKRLGI